MSGTHEARRQVEEARQRLVGTVEEIGTVIDQTKADVQEKARRVVPIAAGAAGAFVLLKVLRGVLRRKR